MEFDTSNKGQPRNEGEKIEGTKIVDRKVERKRKRKKQKKEQLFGKRENGREEKWRGKNSVVYQFFFSLNWRENQ